MMDLSLNAAEREHLAALGITPDERGTLRSASGREVDPGVAVALLTKAAINPADFQRTGPAGPAGPAGSGTADRDMADGENLAKGLVPQRFHRPFLAAGHAAESPANTGMRATTPPPSSHPAEPQDYTRGWIRPGHQAEPPASDPMGNNPHPPGTPASGVYATGAEHYAGNQDRSRSEHLMPSQAITSQPSPSRMALPQDMRASEVPHAISLAASRPAPGESR